MADLDMAKVRSMDKAIKKRAGGESRLFYCKQLTEDGVDVRILEPSDRMNGLYFCEQEGWWVNGKFFQINTTFGGEDVIKNEIETAKAWAAQLEQSENASDKQYAKDLLGLINAKGKGGAPVLKNEMRYLVPVLVLDVKWNNDGTEVTSVTVVDDTGKVLVAKPTLMSAIQLVVGSKQYQNGSKKFLTDRKIGWNVILTKVGAGKETEYNCLGWNRSTEIEDKYYEGDRYPNIPEMIEKMKNSDARLVSIIRNYLYGEAIIEDAKKDEPAKPKAPTPPPPTGAAQAAPQQQAPPPPAQQAPPPQQAARPTPPVNNDVAVNQAPAQQSARPTPPSAGGGGGSARPATGKKAATGKKKSLIDAAEDDIQQAQAPAHHAEEEEGDDPLAELN